MTWCRDPRLLVGGDRNYLSENQRIEKEYRDPRLLVGGDRNKISRRYLEWSG